MSQPTTSVIPLFHAPDGVGYKLLELPPELVSLLESDNPPTLTITPSSTAALLKTPDGKTYSLRQNNTSNTLILLTPNQSPSVVPVPGAETETWPVGGGLCAVATVHETIELVPETAEAAAPAVKARGKWHEKFAKGR
ncbi:hypothetical protein B0T25DRAFT_542585 [Lasiosphaeria hispida]|uniref:Sister chromatid cohesion protein DCC1 n=1 Tax=Lasiosphaeria hispida TaxID=260671 RepID=A0AAJ0MDQ4_9PEZI|nr:hypothetical protein B0T25DRAFT_542585 [Lasiosphaeria hispida]